MQDDAKRFAADTKRKVETFIDEQQLRKKADKASKKASEQLRNFADSAQSSARHTYQSLDSEYQIGEKAERATRQAKEAAKDIDQKYSVRRRVRNFVDSVRTNWPLWQARLNTFADTMPGKVVVVAGFVVAVSTPFFWQVVNLLLFSSFLIIPFAMFILDFARRRALQVQQEQEEERIRQERAANPFADMFRGFNEAGTGAGGGPQSAGRGPTRKAKGGFWGSAGRDVSGDAGPVIEAEWTSLDEDGQKKR
ncbi:MAG: hypothetical protein WDW38_008166 [Sanguina aurantia]